MSKLFIDNGSIRLLWSYYCGFCVGNHGFGLDAADDAEQGGP